MKFNAAKFIFALLYYIVFIVTASAQFNLTHYQGNIIGKATNDRNPTILHVPGDYPTVQEGINAAIDGDTVLVADSTYYENINFKGKKIIVASHFLLDSDTSHISATIINGSYPSHSDSGSVVYFLSGEDTTSILCGFTITGGTGTILQTTPFSVRAGGGIVCRSGAKIVHNCIENNHITSGTFLTAGGAIGSGQPGDTYWIVIKYNIIRNNSITNTEVNGSGGGGGINVQVNAILKENIIYYNTAQSTYGRIWGGGVVLGGDASQPLTRYIIGNTIRFNQALVPTGTDINGGIGGGLAVTTVSKAIIKDNDISYNEVQSNATSDATCFGGGVILQNQNEETIFANNYVAHNKALDNSICRGAGITIWGAGVGVLCNPQLFNNIISDNSNGDEGGGIHIGGWNLDHKPTPTLINNTICNNSSIQGGAVYSSQSHPKIINSILWDNGSEIFQEGGDVLIYYSDVQGGWPGEGNIDFDPLFVPGDSLYHLMSTTDTSMCLNAGIDSIQINAKWYVAPNTDFDNNPRPQPTGTRPDMGAWESDVVNSLEEIQDSQIPNVFVLKQNYPNPFNPKTTIEIQIPNSEFVTLKIYNLLGQEVANLVSETLKAGNYKYTWNATGCASGAYLYRIETASGFIKTKKLLLIK